MELRKRVKEDHQEAKRSVKNPTNDATFRKLTAAYFWREEKNSAHVLTKYFLMSSDECGLIIRSKYK